MATAEKVTIKSQPETYFNLKLSVEEATALRDLLRNVGGSAWTTRRKYTDRVAAALDEAGVERGYPLFRPPFTSGDRLDLPGIYWTAEE